MDSRDDGDGDNARLIEGGNGRDERRQQGQGQTDDGDDRGEQRRLRWILDSQIWPDPSPSYPLSPSSSSFELPEVSRGPLRAHHAAADPALELPEVSQGTLSLGWPLSLSTSAFGSGLARLRLPF